jgi:hypothetical protein
MGVGEGKCAESSCQSQAVAGLLSYVPEDMRADLPKNVAILITTDGYFVNGRYCRVHLDMFFKDAEQSGFNPKEVTLSEWENFLKETEFGRTIKEHE